MNWYQSIRSFPEPYNYFQGICVPEIALPQNILLFLRQHLPSYPLVYPHAHYRYVLLIAYQGKGTVSIDGHLFSLGEDYQVVLIFPHQFHYYLDMDKKIWWLFITFEWPHSPESWFPIARNRPFRLTEESDNWIQKMVSLWLERSKTMEDFRVGIRLGLLLRLLMESIFEESILSLSRGKGTHSIPTHLLWLEKINQLIYSYPDQRFSIKELAQQTNLSERYLRYLAHRYLGMGLGQYLRHIQITRAQSLLAQPELSITQIARLCGFSSLQSFYRSFKQMVRLTPSQYRHQVFQRIS